MSRVILPATSRFAAKDQIKSDKANKFIGRGSPRSSTEAYRRAWGDKANCGHYALGDIVFVSVEGNRRGRLVFDHNEIRRATNAGAAIVTDTPYHRNRPYNIGEREVAAFLHECGYKEVEPGYWVRP